MGSRASGHRRALNVLASPEDTGASPSRVPLPASMFPPEQSGDDGP